MAVGIGRSVAIQRAVIVAFTALAASTRGCQATPHQGTSAFASGTTGARDASVLPRPLEGGPDAVDRVADPPEEVRIEDLIASPAQYVSKQLRATGWVVPCRESISCGMRCDHCSLCLTRAALVVPGKVEPAKCDGNGSSLIIIDPERLRLHACSSTACANNCEATCPFPRGTLVTITGRVGRAKAQQIGFGQDQFVFVPDPT